MSPRAITTKRRSDAAGGLRLKAKSWNSIDQSFTTMNARIDPRQGL
jgi:hypothetical protein